MRIAASKYRLHRAYPSVCDEEDVAGLENDLYNWIENCWRQRDDIIGFFYYSKAFLTPYYLNLFNVIG